MNFCTLQKSLMKFTIFVALFLFKLFFPISIGENGFLIGLVKKTQQIVTVIIKVRVHLNAKHT